MCLKILKISLKFSRIGGRVTVTHQTVSQSDQGGEGITNTISGIKNHARQCCGAERQRPSKRWLSQIVQPARSGHCPMELTPSVGAPLRSLWRPWPCCPFVPLPLSPHNFNTSAAKGPRTSRSGPKGSETSKTSKTSPTPKTSKRVKRDC